jgi:hypothetical protein
VKSGSFPAPWRRARVLKTHEWALLNDAFVRIKRYSGTELAPRDLRQHQLTGDLPSAARHIAHDGTETVLLIRREFWRYFEIAPWNKGVRVVGKVEDRPAERLVYRLPRGGAWYFFVRRANLDKLYPVADMVPSQQPTKKKRRRKPPALEPTPVAEPMPEPMPEPALEDRRPRMHRLICKIAGNEFPGGWEHLGTALIMQKVGDELEKRGIPVPTRDMFLRALGRRKD